MKYKGTKHHIKFDDGESTIFLNIKKVGDVAWSRVYTEHAREWVKKMRNEDSEKIVQKFHQKEQKIDFLLPATNNEHSLSRSSGMGGGSSEGVELGDEDGSTSGGLPRSGAWMGAKKKASKWTGKAGSAADQQE